MLAGLPLDDLLARVASTNPAPGAGPSAAYTGAIAAALVEMVSAIELRKDADAAATAERRDRAAAARTRFLELGDGDVAAYGEVLEVLRRRDEPGHAGRLRDALSRAAEPPLQIARLAADLADLAADAAERARGGVRGEAMTAAVLAEAAVRAAVPLVELNLAGMRDDPRTGEVAELGTRARAALDRALASRRRS